MMNIYKQKHQDNKSQAVAANSNSQYTTAQLNDNRQAAIVQKKQMEALTDKQSEVPVQLQAFIQFGKSKRQQELDKVAKAQKAEERTAKKAEVSETYKVTKAKTPKKVKEVEALNLAEARKEFNVNARMPHIWNRHRPGSTKPGKSLFPAGWNENKAANAVTQVIVDASKYSESAKYGKSVQGYFDGILIEVYFMPSSVEDEFEVSTAYPVKAQRGILTNAGSDEDDV